MTSESSIQTASTEPGSEKRRHPRTQKYGPQALQVDCVGPTGTTRSIEARLWDFSEGGLGMDSPEPLAPGEVIRVKGTMQGPDYSLSIDARSRVAYCRKVDDATYRVGVGFLDVSLHRLAD